MITFYLFLFTQFTHEYNYLTIQALTCILARVIRPLFPEDPNDLVFALSTLLLHAGARLAANEIVSSPVLEHPCAGCLFPFAVELKGAKDLPFDAQIKQFIGIQPEGVQEYEIFDFFELLDHPPAEITQVLQDLLRRGEIDRSAERYILRP